MFKRAFLSTLAALPPLLLAAPAIHADDGVHCTFGPGFSIIAQAIPNQVGGCLSEPTGLDSGNVVQQTTRGQMVWIKDKNLATFVNQGANTTWVLGPFGLQSRPTDQPFSWEGPGQQVAGVSITNHPPDGGAAACLAAAIKADGIDHVVPMLIVLPFNNAGC